MTIIKIPFKRGTTSQNDAYKGLPGEITIDSTKRSLRVHDGIKRGGEEILRKSDLGGVEETLADATTALNAAITATSGIAEQLQEAIEAAEGVTGMVDDANAAAAAAATSAQTSTQKASEVAQNAATVNTQTGLATSAATTASQSAAQVAANTATVTTKSAETAVNAQAAVAAAATAMVLVDAVPPPPLADQPPWAVVDQNGQPILAVNANGVAFAILDRLPGLDILSGEFAYAVCDENGYVIQGLRWDGTVYPEAGGAIVDQAQAAALLATQKASEVALNAATVSDLTTQATSAATSAGASSTVALDSSVKAQAWATKTDVEVEAGQGYGAKKYAQDAAVSSKTSVVSSQAAVAAASAATILVDAVPQVPFADQPPWGVFDQNGQPILSVNQNGVAFAILDRLPGLDILSGEFSHAICDENGYVMQGLRWDGTVYTAGQSRNLATRSMIVRGDLWAVGTDGLPVQITQGVEIADPVLNGDALNFLSSIKGGFVTATATIPSSNDWAPFVKNVLHPLGYGQSLAMGASAAIFTTNPQCANVLRMMQNGLRLIDQDAVIADADCLPLKPLICSTPFESPLAQHVGQLQRNGSLPLGAGVVASLHGRGGYSLAQLAKGSSFYSNAMTATRVVHGDCVAQGLTHSVPYVDMIQGEADRLAAAGDYTLGLLQMQTDFDTDIRALTGQTGVVPMLLDQISNWIAYNITESFVPFEQLEIARLYPRRFVCAGPKYWLQTVPDGIHLLSLSSRRLGAMHARAAAAILEGVEWYPTHCTAASRIANVVTMKFHTPYGRLVADTINVGDPGNLGLRWVDSTNSVTVSSVRVNLDNTVTVTLSGTPTGTNGYIGIADIGISGNGGGPFTGPRACLRDSSLDKCFDGLPLYNWACHQRITVN